MVLKYDNGNAIDDMKGPRGDKGDTGDRGDIGPSGDKGDIGDRGDSGEKGPRGDKGDKGLKGDVGNKGPSGPVGFKGPRGPKGRKGDTGPKGATGDKGDAGNAGNKGPQGLKGDVGAKGDTGPAGPRGNDGPKGPTGSRGEKGETGPRGDTGDRGEDGFIGPKGPQGDKGETGERGPQGDAGLAGEKGINGINGIPGKCIPRPSEVVLAKIGQIIRDDALECYVRVSGENGINKPGLEIIENKKRIIESNISYLEFDGGIIVPTKNIDSINIVFRQDQQNIRDIILGNIVEAFESIYDCNKNAPVVVSIGPNGAPVSVGSPLIDHEYVKLCTCKGDRTGTCECSAKKVDVCKYRAYKTENLKIELEKASDNSKRIETMITSREGFSDMGDAGRASSRVIHHVCAGAVAITFATNKNGERYLMISIVNLDKISMFKTT